jgi:hypothetical protein
MSDSGGLGPVMILARISLKKFLVHATTPAGVVGADANLVYTNTGNVSRLTHSPKWTPLESEIARPIIRNRHLYNPK